MTDVLKHYCDNFRRFDQMELVENLHSYYLPHQYLHIVQLFLREKMKIFEFFKLMTRIKLSNTPARVVPYLSLHF